MGKKNQEAEVVDEAEAKRLRKLAKKAAKEAAAAAAEEEAPAPEKKKKKKQAAEEAPAEEVDEAEAKRQRKAAKNAAKEAAAAAEAAPDGVDEEEAKRQRKAAKKAAKAAAAAEAEAEAAAPAKKSKKEKRAETADDDEAPPAKKAKGEESGASAGGEKSLKVFVKGLPYSVDEPTFRKDFEECGAVTQIQFPLNEEGKPKGFAFVSYATQEGFDAALKFDNTDYSGRVISVTKANESGKGKDGKGGGKGKGKAGDWECPNCGDNVFARNDACRKCGTARPGGAAGGGAKGDSKGGRDNANTVFVRGLPWAVTEDALRKDFAECGEIEKLTMPMNEEGRPKGIAFVKYAAEAGVEAALKFDNTDYGGRTINVSKAEDRGGKGKDGKDGKGKGKDGKGKDGKGKGKKGKGKAPSEAFAKNTGAILPSTGEKKTFDDSDDDE